MQKELEEQINDEKNGNEINLTGEVKMEEIKKRILSASIYKIYKEVVSISI